MKSICTVFALARAPELAPLCSAWTAERCAASRCSYVAASVNIGSVSTRPLDPTRHSLHFSAGCGRRVRSPLKSRTSVRKERSAASEEPPRAPSPAPALSSDWPARVPDLFIHFCLSLCFVARKTHTERKHAKHSASRIPRGASQGCLSSPACVRASRRRTSTPENVSRGKILLLFLTHRASQFLEAVWTLPCV